MTNNRDLEERVAAARAVLVALKTEQGTRRAGMMAMFEALGEDIRVVHGITIIVDDGGESGS